MTLITKCQIFGERCSGTNYLERLIRLNYPLCVTSAFGKKHWMIGDYSIFRNCDDTLFIVIVRNPLTSLQSLALQPHHAPFHYRLPFSTFIRKHWLSYDGSNMPHLWFEEDERKRLSIATKENEIENEENICALRAKKIRSFLAVKELVRNFVLIRYEDLRADFRKISIIEQFGIAPRKELVNEKTYKGGGGAVYQPKVYAKIGDEDIRFINKHLDWELEESLGYEILQAGRSISDQSRNICDQPLNSRRTMSSNMDSGVSVSYIISVRLDTPERWRNLRIVLKWLQSFREWQIVVVEQDMLPKIDASRLPVGVQYVFVRCDEPFNKSRGYNIAYAVAGGDILVFGDADMVMEGRVLSLAVEACRRGFAAVNPYRHMLDLDARESAAFNMDKLPGWRESRLSAANRASAMETICFAGGIFVMRKTAYSEVGGMDEHFQGWGGEDDAMSIKIARHEGRTLESRRGTALHLWHPRTKPDIERDAGYRRNHDLLCSYRESSEDKYRHLLAEQRAVLSRHLEKRVMYLRSSN